MSIADKLAKTSRLRRVAEGWIDWQPSHPLPVSELDLEEMARELAQDPGMLPTEAAEEIGVPDWAAPIVVNRYGDEVRRRARRYRIAETGLTPEEVRRASVQFLVSTIDDESVGVKERLKAVETLAKLTGDVVDRSTGEAQTIDLDDYFDAMRRKLLGIGANDE